MASNDVYALNVLSGVVQKIRPALLDHPTFSKHYLEVDSPDACIECGDQPDEVTTIHGELIDLRETDFEDGLEDEYSQDGE